MSDSTPNSTPSSIADSDRLIIDTDSSDMGKDTLILTRSQTKNDAAENDDDEREPLPPTPPPDASERVSNSLTFLPLP